MVFSESMMPPVSRLGRQIAEVTSALSTIGARYALNLEQVRGYFRLFEREMLLDELLHETG